MKAVFYAGTLLVLFALALAFFTVFKYYAVPLADGSIVSLTHAIKGGDWAHAGDFFGGVIVAKWHDEMAKLLFWIHLFS